MSEKLYCVYLIANYTNTVLYTGVTSDLPGRIYQHQNKLISGFTAKYNVNKLVYYEPFGDVELAIAREKEIKGWKRFRKDELINNENPEWVDLYDEIAE